MIFCYNEILIIITPIKINNPLIMRSLIPSSFILELYFFNFGCISFLISLIFVKYIIV